MGVMADRAAANRILGRVVDPDAHGKHAVDPRSGRVACGGRNYKAGYAPCQLQCCDPSDGSEHTFTPDCECGGNMLLSTVNAVVNAIWARKP